MTSLKRYGPLFGVLLAWLLLFSPRLLPGITVKSLAWVAISAFLFWPLAFRRWSLWLAVVGLAMAGVLDIFHVYFFGKLTDEYLFATALRTTPAEVADFFSMLPLQPLVFSALWLIWCVLAGRWLGRVAPGELRGRRFLRWTWVAPVLVWLALVVANVWGSDALRWQIHDKTYKIYPTHLAWAAWKYHLMSAAVMEPPLLPIVAAAPAQADTVVVVLGESATAQRWSLLGYQGDDTNAPLRGLDGLATATVLARGLNTAGALPFVLTGQSSADSIRRRAPSFLDLAHQAGYKVFVLSNSRNAPVADFFDQVLRRSTAVYRKLGDGGPHDGILTPAYEQALADPAPRKLIVLHTFGSHEIVQDRYPSELARFADPYDNTVLYTSTLLRQWADLLDASGARRAVLLYTSDHGLIMPPCSSDYRHGRSMASLEVPFLAWTNAGARALLPALLPPGEHSNALLAEGVIRAIGYGAVLQQPGWPGSADPTFEGHSWQALRRLDACTLR